jgi:hypothetical protein
MGCRSASSGVRRQFPGRLTQAVREDVAAGLAAGGPYCKGSAYLLVRTEEVT